MLLVSVAAHFSPRESGMRIVLVFYAILLMLVLLSPLLLLITMAGWGCY